MSDAGVRIRAKVQDAIAQALADEHELVTGWVCLIEGMDTDGRRGVWTATDPDAMPWDTLGLLTYSTQIEQGRIVHDEANR